MGTMDSHYNFMSEAEKFVQQHDFSITNDILLRSYKKFETPTFDLVKDIGYLDRYMGRGFEIPNIVNFNLLESLLDTTIDGFKKMQNNYRISKKYFEPSLAINSLNLEPFNNFNNIEMLINESIAPQINNFINSINQKKWDDLNQINKLLYDQIDLYIENSIDISNLVKQIDPNVDYKKVEEKIIENDDTKIITMQDINIIIFTFLLLSFILVWATPENINNLNLSIAEVFKPIWEYFKSESFEMSLEFSPKIFIPPRPNDSIGLYRIVIKDNVILRVSPNVIADKILELEYNEYVKIVNDKENWIFVKVLNKDKEYLGWVRKEEVSTIDRIDFD